MRYYLYMYESEQTNAIARCQALSCRVVVVCHKQIRKGMTVLHEILRRNRARPTQRCESKATQGPAMNANSMTAYAEERDSLVANQSDEGLQKRLCDLTHELRDLVGTATRAMSVIKTRRVDPTGATGALLERCLQQIGVLIDRPLPQAQLSVPTAASRRLISAAQFIADVGSLANLEALSRGCNLKVLPVDERLALYVDRNMLFAALQDLLRSAFRSTVHRTSVRLSAYATADRIRIDIEDHCGGRTSGSLQYLSGPFTQADANCTGVELSLDACRRRIEANDGALSVLNAPAARCVVSIDLPRHLLSERNSSGRG